MTTIQIKLSDNLARKAKQAGLLETAALEGLLQDELARRRALSDLLESTGRASAQVKAMTEEEVRAFVQTEIDSQRAENRSTRASGG